MSEVSAIDILNSAVAASNIAQQNQQTQAAQPQVNGYNLNAVRDAEVDTSALSTLEQDALQLDYNQLAAKYGIDTANQITGSMQQGFLDYYGDKQQESTWGDHALGVAKGFADIGAGLATLAVSPYSTQAAANLYKGYKGLSEDLFDKNMSEGRQAQARALSAVREEQDRLNDYLYEQDKAAGKSFLEADLSAIGRDAIFGVDNIFSNSLAASEAIESAVGSLLPSGVVAKGVGVAANAGARALARGVARAGQKAFVKGTAKRSTTAGVVNALRNGAVSDGTAWALSQGIMEGGAGFSETLNRVMEMDVKDLYKNSPGFADRVVAYTDKGMSKEDAENQAKLDVAEITARVEGAAQGLLGIATGSLTEGTAKMMKNPFGNRGFTESMIKQPIKEAVEEGLQEGGGQWTQNLAVRDYADTTAKLYEDVGKNAAAGAFGGMASSHIMGAPGIARAAAVSGTKAALKGTVKAAGATVGLTAKGIGALANKITEGSVFSEENKGKIKESFSSLGSKLEEATKPFFKEEESTLEPGKEDIPTGPDIPKEVSDKGKVAEAITSIKDLNEDEAEIYGKDISRFDALGAEFEALEQAYAAKNNEAMQDHALGILFLAQPLMNIGSNEDLNGTATSNLTEEEKAAVKDIKDNLDVLANHPELNKVFEYAKSVLTDQVTEAGKATTEELKTNTAKAEALGAGIILDPQNIDAAFSEDMSEEAFEERMDAVQNAVELSKTLTKAQKELFKLARTAISSTRYVNRMLKENKVSSAVVNKAMENLSSGKSEGARISLDDHVSAIRMAYMLGSKSALDDTVNQMVDWYVAQNNRLSAFNESASAKPGKDNKVSYSTVNPETGEWFENEGYLNPKSEASVQLAKAAYAESLKTYQVLKAVGEISNNEALKNLETPTKLTHEVFKQFNKNISSTKSKFKKVLATKAEAKEVNTEDKVVKPETKETIVEDTPVEPKKEEVKEVTEPVVEDKKVIEGTSTKDKLVVENKVEEKTEEPEVKEDSIEDKVKEVKQSSTFVGKSSKFTKYVLTDLIYKSGNREEPEAKIKNSSPIWFLKDRQALVDFIKGFVVSAETIKNRLDELHNSMTVPTKDNKARDNYFDGYELHFAPIIREALDKAFSKALEFTKDNKSLRDENGNFKADNYSGILQSATTKILLFAVKQGDTYVLDPKIKEAACMAAYDWFLQTQLSNPNITAEDVINNREQEISNDQLRALRQGVFASNLIDSLNSSMHAIFDSRPVYDQKPGYASSAIDQLTSEVMYEILRGNTFKVKEVKITDTANNVVATVFHFPQYKIRDPKDKTNALTMAGLFTNLLVQGYEQKAYYDPKAEIPVRGTQLHSKRKLTAKEKDFVKHAQEIKFYRDSSMESTVLDLDEEGLLDLFGYSNVPSPGSKEEAKYHTADLESKRGKNISITGALATIKKEKQIFQENNLEYMRYSGAISSVGRYQMQGENNPQANKVMRIVSTATKSEHVDLTNEATRRLHNRCAAQGFGFKVHQLSDQEISDLINKVLTVDNIFKDKVQPYFDAIFKGNTPSKEVKQNFIVGFKELNRKAGIDKNEWAMLSLKELALTNFAERNGTLNDVTSYAFLEADGVTDGPINYAMMNSTGVFDKAWLALVAKGGFSFFDEGKALIALKHVESDSLGSKEDLYTATKNRLGKAVVKVFDSAIKVAKNPKQQPYMYATLNSVLYTWGVLGSVEVNEQEGFTDNSLITFNPARNTVKNPTTQFVYHAGIESVANTMVQHNAAGVQGMTVKLYNHVSDYLHCEADSELRKLPMGVKFFYKEYDGTNAKALEYKFNALNVALKNITNGHLVHISNAIRNESFLAYHRKGIDLVSLLKSDRKNNFEIKGEALNSFIQNFKFVAGAISNSYQANFSPTYAQDQDVILNTAKSISAIAEIAQEVALNQLNTKGNFGLSNKEVDDAKKVYEGTNSDTVVNGHIAPLSKQVEGGPTKLLSGSVNGGMEISSVSEVAGNPGVSVFANMNINMGDASMVVKSLDNLIRVAQQIPQVLLVFDGIHMGINKIDQYAPEINKATSVAVSNNLFNVLNKKFKESLEAFNKCSEELEKLDPALWYHIAIKMFTDKQIETAGDAKGLVLDKFKELSEQVHNLAIDANSRQFAMKAVGFSSDHMASSENPAYTQGQFSRCFDTTPKGYVPSVDEVLVRLNAARKAYLKAVREYPDYFENGQYKNDSIKFHNFFTPYIKEAYAASKLENAEDQFVKKEDFFLVDGTRNKPIETKSVEEPVVIKPTVNKEVERYRTDLLTDKDNFIDDKENGRVVTKSNNLALGDNALYNLLVSTINKLYDWTSTPTDVYIYYDETSFRDQVNKVFNAPREKTNGFYDPKTKAIHVLGSMQKADKIKTTLHHELIHSITHEKVFAVGNGARCSLVERQAYDNLVRLKKEILSNNLDKFFKTKYEKLLLAHIKTVLGNNTEANGISELLAYFTQSPAIKETLKQAKVDPKNYRSNAKSLSNIFNYVKDFLVNVYQLITGTKVNNLSNVWEIVSDSALVFAHSTLDKDFAENSGEVPFSTEIESSEYASIRDTIQQQLSVLDHKDSLDAYKQAISDPKYKERDFYKKFDNGVSSLAGVINNINVLCSLLPSWTQEQADIATELGIILAHKEGLNPDVLRVVQKSYDVFITEYANKAIAPEYQSLTKVLTGKHPSIKPNEVEKLTLFTSAVLLDNNFKNIVGNLKITNDEKLKTKSKLDNLVNSLGSKGFELLTRFYTQHGTNGITVSDAVDELVKGLAYRNSIPKFFRNSISARIDKKIEKQVSKVLSKATNTAANMAVNTGIINGNTSKMIQTINKMGDINAQNFFEVVSDTVNANEHIPQFIKDLVNDVIGITDDNWSTYSALKKVRQAVQATRQQYNELMPIELLKLFNKAPTKEEHKVMYDVLTKIDVLGLGSSFYNFKKYFTNKIVRQNAVDESIEMIKQYYGDHYSKEVISAANRLVRYLVTGKVSDANLCLNAESIANFNFIFAKNEVYRDLANKADSNVIAAIDKYVSLKMIDSLDQNTVKQFTGILAREDKAMASVVGMLYSYQKAEKSKVYGTRAEYNYIKGKLTPHKTTEGSILIRPASMKHNLEKLGYKVVEEYKGSIYDSNKQLIYYNPFTSVKFNEGIIQLARPTANSVDLTTGFSTLLNAGYITNPARVKAITEYIIKNPTKQVLEQGNNSSLVPVFDAEGNIVAYQRTVPAELESKYLKPEENILNVICRNKGRQIEEQLAQEANDAFLKKLEKQYYDADNKEAFVDVFALAKKDKVVKDALDKLPKSVINYIKNSNKLEGKFYVRRDMLNDTIGYRSASVSDIWTGNSRYSKELLKASQICLEAVLGPNAYRYLRTMENWDLQFMAYVRNTIAVKSVVVPAINIASNVYQLMASGVPFASLVSGSTRKVKELENYLRVRQELLKLEALKAGAKNGREIKAYEERIAQRKAYIKKLSIAPLLEAGEFGIISNVNARPEEMRFSDGSLGDWIDKQADKVPSCLRNLYRYGLVTKDTPFYTALQKSVQYGDFVAKSVLYDYLTTERGMKPDDAIRYVREEFVDYDKSMGRDRQYLESMGLLWFWNFKVRSIKAAARNMRNNPLSALLAAYSVNMFPMDGVGTALTDNLISKLMEGSLGYSLGMGSATKAITDNWVYALLK